MPMIVISIVPTAKLRLPKMRRLTIGSELRSSQITNAMIVTTAKAVVRVMNEDENQSSSCPSSKTSCRAAQGRREREDDDAGNQETLPTEVTTEPVGRRQDDCVRDQITRQHPG